MIKNPLIEIQDQLRWACDFLELDPSIYQLLQGPQRLVELEIPVHMDRGGIRCFKAYRSLHQDLAGPGKGGIRFHPSVNREEVIALSMWMSLKAQISNLPFGGGKGGVQVDPKELSNRELEGLARGYVRGLYAYLGEDIDIPAPDVGSNARMISWMLDEYQQIKGQEALGTFTGKPVELGGSLGRVEATGLGVALMTQLFLEKNQEDLAGQTVAIQGFGNVGSYTHKFLEARGGRVQAILELDPQEGAFGLYNPQGLAYEDLARYQADRGSLWAYPQAQTIQAQDFFSLPVDVLIPAALENAITEENAGLVQARYLVEAANGPISLGAARLLEGRGIKILPDVMANAGGVVVSYFEWVQNRMGHYWSLDQVLQAQEEKMRESFEAISQVQEAHQLTYREAAYLYGVQELAKKIQWKKNIPGR